MSKFNKGDIIVLNFPKIWTDVHSGKKLEEEYIRMFGEVLKIEDGVYTINWDKTGKRDQYVSNLDMSNVRLASKAEVTLYRKINENT